MRETGLVNCARANRRPAGQEGGLWRFVDARYSRSASSAAEIGATRILGERQRRRVLQPRVAAGDPGFGWSRSGQPQRGCVQSLYTGRNPVGVEKIPAVLPRVGARRQPGALSRNGVGVQRRPFQCPRNSVMNLGRARWRLPWLHTGSQATRGPGAMPLPGC